MNEQLQKLKSELEQYEQQSPRNQSKIDAINAEIARMEQEQQLQNDQQEREQRHTENVGGLMEKLLDSGFFEKIYGEKPAEGERIYEYDENRRNFYMIVNAMMEEEKEADRQYYEPRLTERDEKIRRLTEQGMETENQLIAERDKVAELNDKITALDAEAAEQEEVLQKANAERDKAVEQLELEKSKHNLTLNQYNQLGAICDQKNAQITELETKLEQAQRTKASTTTESTKDLIANLKPATNWEAKANKGLERWPELNLPPITEPEAPSVNGGDSFRTEVAAPELTSDQFHTPEAPEAVSEEQFRLGTTYQSQQTMVGDGSGEGGGTEEGQTDNQHVSEAVSRKEFEALKKRVEAIEDGYARPAA